VDPTARTSVATTTAPALPRERAGIKTQLGIIPGETKKLPWEVLRRNRKYRWYFVGSVISDFGTWLQNTAQVLLAYQLSHSVLTVGLVTCAQFSSPLAIAPVTSHDSLSFPVSSSSARAPAKTAATT